MNREGTYIGIDVAKAPLDLAVHLSGDPWRVTNDLVGIETTVTRLRGLHPALVVVEPTGGLELPLTAALAAAGLPVAVVNPRQVRDFAKATGRLAKTDRLDAQVLAHFAQAVNPALRPCPTPKPRSWLRSWRGASNWSRCSLPKRTVWAPLDRRYVSESVRIYLG